MTKRNLSRTTRSLTAADLTAVTGGYAVSPTYALNFEVSPKLAAIINLSKSHDDVAAGDVDNIK